MPLDEAPPFAVARRRALAERRIDVLLDVGANTGQYGRAVRGEGYRGRIVSFEPLPDAGAELERRAAADPAWTCVRVALGSVDGFAELHVAGNSVSSSLLPMTAAHVASAPGSGIVGAHRVRVARLDSLAPELLRAGDRLYLKLDVQGAELSVLEGATETAGRARAVECELTLVPLYEGQPLFADVLGALEAAGLELVALEPSFTDPRSGRILQLNGLFLRR